MNKEEKVDYYHAYDANEPHALDVPAEGEYEVSFISPVDKDGSIYEVPKTAKVKSEAEDKDGKDTGDELPFEFKPIAADKTDADALNAIVKSIGEAVKKGDETLTGAKGTKVIELVKDNAKANPNADKDKVDEEGQKAEEGVTDERQAGTQVRPSPRPAVMAVALSMEGTPAPTVGQAMVAAGASRSILIIGLRRHGRAS